MTTYKRRQTDTIEATQFTSELGGIVRGVTAGTAPDGLEHSEHSGYSFHGQRVVFGDYLAGSVVLEKTLFEKQWELATVYDDKAAHVLEGKALLAAAAARDAEDRAALAEETLAKLSATGSVAVDTVLASKAKQRSKRTEPTS